MNQLVRKVIVQEQTGQWPQRYEEVDFFRGLAIVLMIVFHAIFDLKTFGIASISTNIELPRLFWQWFPNLSSTLFLLLVGVSAVLATEQASHPFRKIVRQSVKVLAGAALVTLGSLVTTPRTVVHFGVLHCIGISLLMIYPFLRFTLLNFVLGLGILGAGEAIGSVPISTPWFMALGIRPASFQTGDYFPLVPFFGLVLIGVALGRTLYRNRRFRLEHCLFLRVLVQGKVGRSFQRLGHHSLLIYLIHQPALLLLFYCLGLLDVR